MILLTGADRDCFLPPLDGITNERRNCTLRLCVVHCRRPHFLLLGLISCAIDCSALANGVLRISSFPCTTSPIIMHGLACSLGFPAIKSILMDAADKQVDQGRYLEEEAFSLIDEWTSAQLKCYKSELYSCFGFNVAKSISCLPMSLRSKIIVHKFLKSCSKRMKYWKRQYLIRQKMKQVTLICQGQNQQILFADRCLQ